VIEKAINTVEQNTHPKFMKRLYYPRDFYRFMQDMISSIKDMRIARRKNLISSQFGERIMMAVTEVNGCRYCTYFHIQVALQSGLNREEIRKTLSGNFSQSPEEELPALLFAQHYAEYTGKPDPEMVDNLMATYGDERGRAIVGYIRAIMIGNAWGNAFDSLRFRLKGQPSPDMTLGQELGVFFGPLVMGPFLVIKKTIIGSV
jgi:AhpD family alkylhydroperoxidase